MAHVCCRHLPDKRIPSIAVMMNNPSMYNDNLEDSRTKHDVCERLTQEFFGSHVKHSCRNKYSFQSNPCYEYILVHSKRQLLYISPVLSSMHHHWTQYHINRWYRLKGIAIDFNVMSVCCLLVVINCGKQLHIIWSTFLKSNTHLSNELLHAI